MKALILLASLVFISETFANSYFDKQWGLVNSGQEVAHDISELKIKKIKGVTGADLDWINVENKDIKKDKVVVAVIDSGLDVKHPDLENRVWFNEKLCKGLKSEDMAGKPCYGWNFLDANHDISDDVGHGTFVAGVIAANDNNIGIKGATSSNVVIMPLKVQKKSLSSFVYKKKVVTNLVAEAIVFAIKNGADVINLSMGWPKMIHTKKVRFAIDQAIKANIPVVAASGNNGKNIPIYPCSYKGVICVGAMNNVGEMARFSNYGHKVDVIAPGESILGTFPVDLESRIFRVPGYEKKKGTSFATPYVSSVLAMLKATKPSLSISQMKANLYLSNKISNKGDSLFGAVSMKETLRDKSEPLLIPNLKDLLEVKVVGNEFRINIPLNAVSTDASVDKIEDVEVSFKILDKNVSLINNSIIVDSINVDQPIKLSVKGNVNIEEVDSSVKFELSVKVKGGESNYIGELFLTRSILPEENQYIDFPRIHPSKLGVFSKGRKVSLLKKVIAQISSEDKIHYYTVSKQKNTSNIIVDLIETGVEKTQLVKLVSEVQGDVLAVFKADYNLDGKNDFLVYSLNEKSKLIQFSYFNLKGEQLFKSNSVYSLELSSFRGVEFNAAKAKFSLLKVTNSDGEFMLTPAMIKTWNMPEEDNVDDFMFELPNTNKNRLYYFLPRGDRFSIRTLESFSFVESIYSELDIYDSTSIQVLDVMSQTKEELNNGEVSVLFRAETFEGPVIFEVSFKDNSNFEVFKIFSNEYYLDFNTLYSLRNEQGNVTKQRVFAALHKRDEVRLTNGLDLNMEFSTNSWDDPISRQVGNWSIDNDFVSMVESRYSIHVASKRGNDLKTYKLPIYRDSSFPGVYFSETYQTYVKENNPSLFMNSTQIFGNRLYSMEFGKDGFKRPLSKSVDIPAHCAFMNLNEISSKMYLTFMCKTKKGLKLFNYKY